MSGVSPSSISATVWPLPVAVALAPTPCAAGCRCSHSCRSGTRSRRTAWAARSRRAARSRTSTAQLWAWRAPQPRRRLADRGGTRPLQRQHRPGVVQTGHAEHAAGQRAGHRDGAVVGAQLIPARADPGTGRVQLQLGAERRVDDRPRPGGPDIGARRAGRDAGEAPRRAAGPRPWPRWPRTRRIGPRSPPGLGSGRITAAGVLTAVAKLPRPARRGRSHTWTNSFWLAATPTVALMRLVNGTACPRAGLPLGGAAALIRSRPRWRCRSSLRPR